MDLILPTAVINGEPVCSRCGMTYGTWEMNIRQGDHLQRKPFVHRPGCKWTVGNHKKDFGPMLRAGGFISSDAKIIRTF